MASVTVEWTHDQLMKFLRSNGRACEWRERCAKNSEDWQTVLADFIGAKLRAYLLPPVPGSFEVRYLITVDFATDEEAMLWKLKHG